MRNLYPASDFGLYTVVTENAHTKRGALVDDEDAHGNSLLAR